jgi:hypothetical protein
MAAQPAGLQCCGVGRIALTRGARGLLLSEVPRATAMAESEPGAPKRPLLPDYFYRLSPRLQRCYLKSESIDRLDGFAPTAATAARLRALMAALDRGAVREVERSAAALIAEFCRSFGIAPIRVAVLGVRPHNARGELHGLYRLTKPPEIVLWMRTAKRRDVVKPRTFLRTLLHELCHYLDYALLRLDDSFHTMGFFRRESFLMHALAGTRANAVTDG